MFGEPPVDESTIAAALAMGWGLAGDLAYAPVGFGSYHWWLSCADGARLFVTLDDVSGVPASHQAQRLAAFEAAFATAADLAGYGHAFVRAPMPARDGRSMQQLDDGRALSLWAYVDGTSAGHGDYDQADDLRRSVLGVLRSLHSTPLEVVSRAHVETFAVDHSEFLDRLVRWDLDDGWADGPYGAPARELAERHRGAIGALRSHYDRLVEQAPPRDAWVITHGEPHAANVVTTADGPVLIDWDTALIAPRERDLWMVLAGRAEVDAAYAGETADGLPPVRPEMLRLYTAHWELTELGVYFQRFHASHGDGADTEASWADLQTYLPLEPRWPELTAGA